MKLVHIYTLKTLLGRNMGEGIAHLVGWRRYLEEIRLKLLHIWSLGGG